MYTYTLIYILNDFDLSRINQRNTLLLFKYVISSPLFFVRIYHVEIHRIYAHVLI